MAQRNIHGEWTMSFENGILRTKVVGATNAEAGEAWLNELQTLLRTSTEGTAKPWVMFADNRQWDISPLDARQANNALVDWMSHHNCVLCVFVLSKKLQEFALESQINQKGMMQIFFDYDKAYQACLDKLVEVRNQ